MGALYLVSVPIGNLEDITLRALRILRTVPKIACEDTRTTGKLLELLGISDHGAYVSLHDHNEEARIPAILGALEVGDVALVSDAGTPAISDPGFRLVRAAVEAGFTVVPIPGACAALAALCAAGLPTDRFRFVGFLAQRGGARRKELAELCNAAETLVFYVSPHQLDEFLEDAQGAFGGERRAVVARELTKKFEEFRRGSLAELVALRGIAKGEVVVLVEGVQVEEGAEEEGLQGVVAALLAEGWSPTRAAKEAARRTGGSRDVAYRLAVELRQGGEEP